MLRDFRFKRLIKKVYKICDKYGECKGCPFARPTVLQGIPYNECNLTNWHNGNYRYPYEYDGVLEEIEVKSESRDSSESVRRADKD